MNGRASTFVTRCLNRVLFRWRRARLEEELVEELEFHRSLSEAASARAGLPPDAARERSRRRMGNLTLAREESRDRWSFVTLENLLQDLRYATRIFLRAPAFTAVAVLSLALGIGGNAAMFSLVDCLLVRRLPYPEPERLVRITGIFPRAAVPAFQQGSRGMTVAAANEPTEENLSGVGEPLRVFASAVSANAFSVLGASVALGRSFAPGEDSPGRDAVVILSDSLWRHRFGADATILGRTVVLRGTSREVVGVMPPGFSFPSAKAQAWIPMRIDPKNFLEYWAGSFVTLFARLTPEASLEQARGDVRALVADFRPSFPYPMPRDFNADSTAVPLQQDMMGAIHGKLVLLLAAVGLVLLIACANVASLLLSRAAGRRREIALRIALGAERGRIVRQLLTESTLLAALGGVAGLLLGMSALSIFKSVLPSSTPGLAQAAIDWRVTAVVAFMALSTGLVFGIAPALSASQVDLATSVKTGSPRFAGLFWTRLRSGLISAEIALTVVLVVGAGLLVRSLYTLAATEPGFRATGILAVHFSPEQSLCAERATCIALYDQLLGRARALEGVTAAAVVNSVPLDGTVSALAVDVEGHPKTIENPAPLFAAVAASPDYLRLMQIPLLAGRGLLETDGARSERVLLVSAATAKRYWPGENAVGKHVRRAGETEWRTVVGVVADVRQFRLSQDLPDSVRGAIYMPYPQAVREDGQIPAPMTILVKTEGSPARIAHELQSVARAQRPDVPVGPVRSLDEIVAVSIADFRSTIQVFGSFACVALALAAIGVYGLLSHWVAQRTYEIGVRSAIGATKPRIVWMIVSEGLRLAFLGIAVGGLAALALTRFLTGLLQGVRPNDPLTFAAVFVFVLAVAATAALAPAWRAANIDPVRALRAE